MGLIWEVCSRSASVYSIFLRLSSMDRSFSMLVCTLSSSESIFLSMIDSRYSWLANSWLSASG